VSSSDFPVFRLSEPEPVAKPVAQANPRSTERN
jgi:hypothetical protein